MQQVLLNLAGNAVKFTERGEVEISVRTLTEDSGSPLEFAVRDTGIGMEPASQERLFEPFAQVDASMGRRFGGTGLGLSICKSLVEAMGGRIWFESEPGRGSTFRFTVHLPIAEKPSSDSEARDVQKVAERQLHILLAEDNLANQKLAAYILKNRGHTVEIAAEEEDRDRCLAAGMDAYLPKPIKSEELIGLVESLAGRGKPAAVTAFTPVEGSSRETDAVFDPEEALARCYGRQEMLRDMIQFFFVERESLFPQMWAALEKGELGEVGRLGHRLKGTLVYLGARPAVQAALRVERLAKLDNGTESESGEAIQALEHESLVLKEALSAHSLTGSPAPEPSRSENL
ncbi:MAG: ATP-binding protein [Acidobacteriota bacterium]